MDGERGGQRRREPLRTSLFEQQGAVGEWVSGEGRRHAVEGAAVE